MKGNTGTTFLLGLVLTMGIAEVLSNIKKQKLANVTTIGDYWPEIWIHGDEGRIYQIDPAQVPIRPGTTVYQSMRDAFASTNGVTTT